MMYVCKSAYTRGMEAHQRSWIGAGGDITARANGTRGLVSMTMPRPYNSGNKDRNQQAQRTAAFPHLNSACLGVSWP